MITMDAFEERTEFILKQWYSGNPVSRGKHTYSAHYALSGAFTDKTVEETILSVLSERVAGIEGCTLLTKAIQHEFRKMAEDIAAQQMGYSDANSYKEDHQ